jgi:hypothetical protein
VPKWPQNDPNSIETIRKKSFKKPDNCFFYDAFVFWGAIWAPPNQPKKVNKGPQVGSLYGPMSKLKNKPLAKPLGPFFQEKWSKTTRKLFFKLFSFFAIWAPPNRPKKDHKGLQVGRMNGPMSKLKNKPLTKSLGPLFKEKWSKTTRKLFCSMLLLFFSVLFGHPQIDQEMSPKVFKGAGCMAQCLSSKTSP